VRNEISFSFTHFSARVIVATEGGGALGRQGQKKSNVRITLTPGPKATRNDRITRKEGDPFR